MSLILYEHPLSPYAQKNKIALREKGLQFELRTPSGVGSGAEADPVFMAASPRGEVPALVDESAGVALCDSTVILEYLEEAHADPPLHPDLPSQRARARWIEEVMDTLYEPINWGLSEVRNFERASGELAQRLEEAARDQTSQLQSWLTHQLGEADWFGVERFGWADLCVAPFVQASRGFGIEPASRELAAWLERIAQRPSVRETFEEAAAAASQMQGVAEWVRQGLFQRQYRDHRLEWMVRSGGLEVVRRGLERGDIRFSRLPS